MNYYVIQKLFKEYNDGFLCNDYQRHFLTSPLKEFFMLQCVDRQLIARKMVSIFHADN